MRVRLLLFVGVLWAVPGWAEEKKPNPLVTALAFTQQYGKPNATMAAKDRALKVQLLTTLAHGPELPWDKVSDLFEAPTFAHFAGKGNPLTVETMAKQLQAKVPVARLALHAKTRLHADLLTTQFDLIEEQHRQAAERFIQWIVTNYDPNKELWALGICSHNTRRSMLSATMGNIATAYYGLPNIRFGSGGTNPNAINPRTLTALKDIGVVIETTKDEAPRGTGKEPNPIYRVQWGDGLETREFSKKYTDNANPQQGYAALLVCSEADAACPVVAGASIRIAVPYLDPKAYDGSPIEAAKYAERRDDIGRFMLHVMQQARRRLEVAGKIK